MTTDIESRRKNRIRINGIKKDLTIFNCAFIRPSIVSNTYVRQNLEMKMQPSRLTQSVGHLNGSLSQNGK